MSRFEPPPNIRFSAAPDEQSQTYGRSEDGNSDNDTAYVICNGVGVVELVALHHHAIVGGDIFGTYLSYGLVVVGGRLFGCFRSYEIAQSCIVADEAGAGSPVFVDHFGVELRKTGNLFG